MLRKFAKVTALGLCAALLFLGMTQEAQAFGDVSEVLPSGGISVALTDGVPLDNIQDNSESSNMEIATMIE